LKIELIFCAASAELCRENSWHVQEDGIRWQKEFYPFVKNQSALSIFCRKFSKAMVFP
jgi:5'(3')-deoxyribonucleotidase